MLFVERIHEHNINILPAFLDKDGKIEDDIIKVMKGIRTIAESISHDPTFQKLWVDPRIGNHPELNEEEVRLVELLGQSYKDELINAKKRMNAENTFNGMAFESIVETWFNLNRSNQILNVKDVEGLPIERDYGRDFIGKSTKDGKPVSIQIKDRRNPKKMLTVKRDLGTWCALDYNDGIPRDRDHRILITTGGGIHYNSRKQYFNQEEVTVLCAYPKEDEGIDIRFFFRQKGFWEDLLEMWELR